MLGWQEVVLILAILLLVFGPTKLPKIAKELGNAMHEFNKASSGVITPLGSTPTTKNGDTTKNEDKSKLLLEIARKLDVNTGKKADDELAEEILTKVINMKEDLSNKEELP